MSLRGCVVRVRVRVSRVRVRVWVGAQLAFEAALAVVQHRVVGVAQPRGANPLVQIPGRLVRVRVRVRARARVRVKVLG